LQNVYLSFLGKDRPLDAQAGEEIKLHVREKTSRRPSTLHILVDNRINYPSSIELQGYTDYGQRHFRATVVLNQTQPDIDSITLIYHP